jgi:hypothetical protein
LGGAGIGGSSRSCLHEKHSVLLFFLGKRSLLVFRFTSCETVLGGAGIGGSSRSCLHEKHSVLLFFLGKRSLLVFRFASCETVLGGAGIGGSSRSFWIFRPCRGMRCRTRDGEKATATRLLPSRRRVMSWSRENKKLPRGTRPRGSGGLHRTAGQARAERKAH